MKYKRYAAATALVLTLGACGGGEGNDVSAEGFWSASDQTAAILITSTGELWGVEVSTSGDILYKGTVSTNGSTLSAQISAYTGSQKINGTASGTIKAKDTISGTVSGGGQSSSFSLNYSSFYENAPNLSSLAGTYSVSSGGTVSLSSNGALTGDNGSGCGITGSASTDGSGKNFYRVSYTYANDVDCGSLSGASANGVFVAQTNNSLVGGVVSGNLGAAFFLTKQ